MKSESENGSEIPTTLNLNRLPAPRRVRKRVTYHLTFKMMFDARKETACLQPQTLWKKEKLFGKLSGLVDNAKTVSLAD